MYTYIYIICIYMCMPNNTVHISEEWRRDVYMCNVPS